jgi:hypothetical protein
MNKIQATLSAVNEINTSDVLYDTNLKQFCVYPQTDNQIFDEEYIKKNCLKIVI